VIKNLPVVRTAAVFALCAHLKQKE